jgi:hypothetical protein
MMNPSDSSGTIGKVFRVQQTTSVMPLGLGDTFGTAEPDAHE